MAQTQEISEFNSLLGQRIKELQEVQTVWVIVKSVDWASKTMVATGVVDDLDYHEVILGLGYDYKKPSIGSTCLIGVINNNPGNTFLINGETIDEHQFISGTSRLTIKKDGFVIQQGSESLKQVLNDMIDELNKIIVIQGTTINVGAMNAIKQRLNTILKE